MSRCGLSILDLSPTPALVSVVLLPTERSNRTALNFLKPVSATAIGRTVFEGVTAISRLYLWSIEARVKEWELQRLERIIWLQQRRLAIAPNTAQIILRDEFAYINSLESNINGRSPVAGSAITSNGETAYYSDFNVLAEIPNNAIQKLDPWNGLEASVDITLILTEVI